MRPVMSLKAVATSRCSAEPSTLARASRSPWLTRLAVPARPRIGFARDPAMTHATARPSSSATAPTPASASTSFRCSLCTASTLWVTRTAPAARPFSATGTAVKRRSSSSRSLWRSPCVGRPRSALRISGRLPYRSPRELRPAESAATRPSRSTTSTRPPRLWADRSTSRCSWSRSSRWPEAPAATSCAWLRASFFTSASTLLDRFSASGTASATITSTRTYVNATTSRARRLIARRRRRTGSPRRGRCG